MLFMTRRWLDSRSVRRSAAMLTVAFMLLGSLFVSVSAFNLTASQQADMSLGRYQQKTYTSVYLGDLPSQFLGDARANFRSKISDSQIYISTSSLSPDNYPKAFVKASIPTVQFTEDPELRDGFQDRYTLNSGIWPQSTRDVAISRHLADILGQPDNFSVLSGKVNFHVVGIVNDAFAETGDLIIAGAGTWESLPAPALDHAYQPTEAEVVVLWGSDGSLSAVSRILQAVLPPFPDGGGDRSDQVAGNYLTRAQIENGPVGIFGSDSIVISYLPLLLVLLLVSALVVRQTRAENLASAERLLALGIRRMTVQLTQVTALCLAACASIVVGLAAGWLIGIGLRATVLPHYASQPLSPLPALGLRAVMIAGLALLIIAVGTLWPERVKHSPPQGGGKNVLANIPFTIVRRVAALAIILLSLKVDRQSEGETVLVSYLAILGLILMTPDILRIAVLLLSRNNARTLVIRRLMTIDRGRQAVAAAVVASCVAVPICAATQITSQNLSQAGSSYSLIPPGQIWVESGLGPRDIAKVGQIVSAVPGIGRPIVIRDLTTPERLHSGNAAYAHFLFEPKSGSYNSRTLVLDSAKDLVRLVGTQAGVAAEATLDSGGIIDFTGAVGDEQFAVDSADGKRTIVPVVFPTLKLSLDRQFSEQYAGAILLATADRYRLPISDPTKYVFTDVAPSTIEQAITAVVARGYDSRFVEYNVAPPSPNIPTSWYVFLTGLVLGGFAVLVLVVGDQASRLRSYNSRLLSIGVTRRWVLSLLGIQAALIVGVGLVLGIASGLLGTIIVTDSYLALSVPALPIVVSCVATMAAASIATALAIRTLTATDGPELN